MDDRVANAVGRGDMQTLGAGIKKRGIKPGQRKALLEQAKAKAQQLADKVTS